MHSSYFHRMAGLLVGFACLPAADKVAHAQCGFPPENWQAPDQQPRPGTTDDFGPLSDADNLEPICESLRFAEDGLLTDIGITGAFINASTGVNAAPTGGAHAIEVTISRGATYRPLHVPGTPIFSGTIFATPTATGNQMVGTTTTFDEYEFCLTLPAPIPVKRGETLFFCISNQTINPFVNGLRFLWNWGPNGLGDEIAFSGPSLVRRDMSIGANVEIMQVSELGQSCDAIGRTHTLHVKDSPVLQLPVGRCQPACTEFAAVTWHSSPENWEISGWGQTSDPIAVAVRDGCTGVVLCSATDVNLNGAGSPLSVGSCGLEPGEAYIIEFDAVAEAVCTVGIPTETSCPDPVPTACEAVAASYLDPDNPIYATPAACNNGAESFGNSYYWKVNAAGLTDTYTVDSVNVAINANAGPPCPAVLRIIFDQNDGSLCDAAGCSDMMTMYEQVVTVPGGVTSPTFFKWNLHNPPTQFPGSTYYCELEFLSNETAAGGPGGVFTAPALVSNGVDPGAGQALIQAWDCGVFTPLSLVFIGVGSNTVAASTQLSCTGETWNVFGSVAKLGDNTLITEPVGTNSIRVGKDDPLGSDASVEVGWGDGPDGVHGTMIRPNGFQTGETVSLTSMIPDATLPCEPKNGFSHTLSVTEASSSLVLEFLGDLFAGASIIEISAFSNGDFVHSEDAPLGSGALGSLDNSINMTEMKVSQILSGGGPPQGDCLELTLTFAPTTYTAPSGHQEAGVDTLEIVLCTGFTDTDDAVICTSVSSTEDDIKLQDFGPTVDEHMWTNTNDAELSVDRCDDGTSERCSVVEVANLPDGLGGVACEFADPVRVRQAQFRCAMDPDPTSGTSQLIFSRDGVDQFIAESTTDGCVIIRPASNDPGALFDVSMWWEGDGDGNGEEHENIELESVKLHDVDISDLERLTYFDTEGMHWYIGQTQMDIKLRDGSTIPASDPNYEQLMITPAVGPGSARFAFGGLVETFPVIGIRGGGMNSIRIFGVTVIRGGPGDANGDGFVDILDLLQVLADWGLCSPPCPSDLNADAQVGIVDLLEVLANWGT